VLILDTSVAIHVRDADPATLARVEQIGEPIRLSIITWVELEGGLYKEPRSLDVRWRALDRMLLAFPPMDLNSKHVAAYARIVQALGFSRPQLLDRLIAAQAIVAGARLATLNGRDFQLVPELLVEDWSIPPA
jgi:predicted nucleic acid-binding protein